MAKEPTTKSKDANPADLGDHVRDKVTGFKGIVTGVFKYMNGCVRLMLEARTLKDGKPIEAYTVDDSQVEVIKRQAVPTKYSAYSTRSGTGGPRPTPATRLAPRQR